MKGKDVFEDMQPGIVQVDDNGAWFVDPVDGYNRAWVDEQSGQSGIEWYDGEYNHFFSERDIRLWLSALEASRAAALESGYAGREREDINDSLASLDQRDRF
jgi:hypothetical protein